MDAKLFGARLRQLRDEAGLTRDELAEKAGLRSAAGIRDIEQGLRKPLHETIVAIAKALGRSLDDFHIAPSDPSPRSRGRPRKRPEND